MNKHMKLALFVAPILIVLGYIVSDYFLEYKAEENKLFQLIPEGTCDILSEKCVLQSGEFKVNIFDKEGITTINSTFPLDSAILFLVDEQNIATPYPMTMTETPYYWQARTPLRENFSSTQSKQKLRLIAQIKGGKYISEFYSQMSN